MLTYLEVRNFAIIDHLAVEFGQGLNVFTGETGAGKSIILKALNLLLGQRSSAEDIRKGAETAELQAIFLSSDPQVQQLLRQHELLDENEPQQILIRRLLKKEGSKVLINGSVVSLQVLGEITENLVSISAQHSQKELQSPEFQLALVDMNTSSEDLQAVQSSFRQYREAQKQREQLDVDEDYKNERLEYLRYQLGEIDELNPEPGELENLTAQVKKMQGFQELASMCSAVEQTIYGDDGVLGRMEDLQKQIRGSLRHDQSLTPTTEEIELVLTHLESVGRTVSQYARKMNLDDDDTQRTAERLEALQKLLRKHGGTYEALLDKRSKLQIELTSLENLEQAKLDLDNTIKAELVAYQKLAEKVHRQRQATAEKLSKEVTKHLRTLNMESATLTIKLNPGTPSLSGFDVVEILLAPNKGEGAKPLTKIASGGELSRVMLALHRVGNPAARTPTLMFDEVDAGIGGDVGRVVGEQLRAMSTRQQILCITHLPQVAVFGHQHLVITKQELKGRTVSTLTKVEGLARTQEVARMLGGKLASKVSQEHAEAMLAAVE